MKTLDRCVKVRRAVYRRILHDKFEFKNFKEEERIQLILNGLKDPDK